MKTAKIKILQDIATKEDLQGVLVYSMAWRKENFRYLTGANFFGPYAMVLYLAKTNKISLILSSDWDKQRIKGKLTNIDRIIVLGNNWSGLGEMLQANQVKSLGVSDAGFLPAGLAKTIKDAGVTIKSTNGYIEKIRYRKTPEEVECLRAAVNLADRAFPVFMESIAKGLNEFQIVAEVEYALKKMGAEDNFMLISTGGPEVYGMTPPMARIAKQGNLVLTELTPQLNGWWCQICRTVVKGEPSSEQLRIFNIFKEAEEAGLAMVKPGVNIADVAKAENDVFRKYGYGEYTSSKYTRVRGHGQGMHLDEAPTVNEDVDLVIEEGMVIVIHPNTFNPVTGYMVIGDPVVVTKNGNELLSTTERKLFHV